MGFGLDVCPLALRLSQAGVFCGLLSVVVCLGAVSCREERAVDRPETGVLVPKGQSAKARQAQVQERFAALPAGAPARVVWVQDPSESTSDTFAESESLNLMGWDPREGGPRRLVAGAGNFGRPLITPDGRSVVFTEKRIQRRDGARHFKPRIRVVDWESAAVRTLAKGYAVDTWADPATGKTWIYALETIHPSRQPSVNGSRLVRFELTAPERRETVWTRTRLSVDSVQVSRDGRKFSALFPWPDAGLGDVATGQWTKLDVGCWPGLAPDDSYVSWIFDGPHRNLRMVAPDREARWKIALSTGPEMRGKEAYHPRWSNHPRFIVFTGPYTKKRSGSRNAISSGGLSAEIHIGTLAPDLTHLESSLRLTHNKNGDFYPDLWIGGAEASTLAGFPQRPAAANPPPVAWPPSPEGLIYVWRDLRAANELPEATGRGACHLEARRTGRFSADLGALLDGGGFEADADSNQAIAASIRSGKGMTIQFVVTESAGHHSGAARSTAPLPLLAWQPADGPPTLQIDRRDGDLVLSIGRGQDRATTTFSHPPAPGRAMAVALVWQGNSMRLAVDGGWLGAPLTTPENLTNTWPEGALVLGNSTPPANTPSPAVATIERLTVHNRPLPLPEIADRARLDLAATQGRPTPPRVRVRARVVEATPPDLDSLDTYRRLLVDHTYEVTSVLEGAMEAKRIAVLHWAALDEAPVPGIPREVGREFELVLEPQSSHPELQGELTQLGSEEFSLPVYLDVAPPGGR